MSESVGQLHIEVTVQLAKMQAQFDDLQRRNRALTNKINSDYRAMSRGIQTAMGAVGLTLAPTALIAFGKSVVDLGSKITDLSAVANINSGALQTLSYHFMDSGVTMEELSKAFIYLRKNAQEAVSGNKAMRDSFNALNVDAAKLQLLPAERQLEALAIAITKAKDQNAAFGAALDLLGTKQAPKLMAALKELGVQGFDALSEKSKKWTLTPEQLKALDDAGDKLARMAAYAKVLSAQGFLAALDAMKNNKYVQTAMAGMTLPFGGAGIIALEAFRQKAAATDSIMNAQQRDSDDAAAAEAALKVAQQYEKVAGTTADVEGQAAQRRKTQLELLKQLEEETKTLIETSKEQNKESREANKLKEEEVARFKDLAAPWKKYQEDIAKVNKLRDEGRISSKLAAQAIAELQDAAFEARFGKESERPLDFDMEKMSTAAKAMQSELNQMWNSVSDRAGQAFADMVLSGEAAFGDLVNLVARAAIEMVARLAIINPIMNALFGGFSAFGMLPAFFGAGAAPAAAAATTSSASYAGLFADGGTLRPGEWGIAGEAGPEPIFGGTTGMTVIPNGGMGNKGDTFNITYNVAAGPSRAEVMNALKVQQQDTIAKITEARRRGGN